MEPGSSHHSQKPKGSFSSLVVIHLLGSLATSGAEGGEYITTWMPLEANKQLSSTDLATTQTSEELELPKRGHMWLLKLSGPQPLQRIWMHTSPEIPEIFNYAPYLGALDRDTTTWYIIKCTVWLEDRKKHFPETLEVIVVSSYPRLSPCFGSIFLILAIQLSLTNTFLHYTDVASFSVKPEPTDYYNDCLKKAMGLNSFL